MPYYYLDARGNPLQVIDNAAVWITCPHDEGQGACHECLDDGTARWAAQRGTRVEVGFDDADDALAWVNV